MEILDQFVRLFYFFVLGSGIIEAFFPKTIKVYVKFAVVCGIILSGKLCQYCFFFPKRDKLFHSPFPAALLHSQLMTVKRSILLNLFFFLICIFQTNERKTDAPLFKVPQLPSRIRKILARKEAQVRRAKMDNSSLAIQAIQMQLQSSEDMAEKGGLGVGSDLQVSSSALDTAIASIVASNAMQVKEQNTGEIQCHDPSQESMLIEEKIFQALEQSDMIEMKNIANSLNSLMESDLGLSDTETGQEREAERTAVVMTQIVSGAVANSSCQNSDQGASFETTGESENNRDAFVQPQEEEVGSKESPTTESNGAESERQEDLNNAPQTPVPIEEGMVVEVQEVTEEGSPSPVVHQTPEFGYQSYAHNFDSDGLPSEKESDTTPNTTGDEQDTEGQSRQANKPPLITRCTLDTVPELRRGCRNLAKMS